jgi:hypothetical protein
MAGEITTLKHEVWNHTMEDSSFIMFTSWSTFADGGKVLGGLWDNIIIEFKVDTALLSYSDVRNNNN